MPFTTYLTNKLLDHTFANTVFPMKSATVTGDAATDLFTDSGDTFAVGDLIRFSLISGVPGSGDYPLVDGGEYFINTKPTHGVYRLNGYYGNYYLVTFTGNVVGTFRLIPYVNLHYGDPGDSGINNWWRAAGRMPFRYTTTSTTGIVSNSQDIVWTTLPPPSAEVVSVSHFSIWTRYESGSALAYGPVPVPRTVEAGDNLTIAAGELTLALT